MIKRFTTYHLEWVFLLSGLLLLAWMNPYTDQGTSLCLFDALNMEFCPGEGLGHSIAFTFRGDFQNAWSAHPVGPPAVAIMGGRIFQLWKRVLN